MPLGGGGFGPNSNFGAGFGQQQQSPSDPPPLGDSFGDEPWPFTRNDMPQIKNINVQCEKSYMRVHVEFDRPFYGMIFSKGHYSDPSCVHMVPQSGNLVADFDIYLNSCGMTSSTSKQNYDGPPTPSGSYVENTLIIQYDPLVQEVWDQARRLRCTWYDYYEKAVTFRPFQVDNINAVTANFLGDNLQCWMQIQVGKGPWASEVSGIVKIGQTMTMVLAIKDDENKFDMLVRNCVAHDGKRAPIQLVDEFGCVTRPKIMSRFQKIKDFGSSASVVSYAYFQAFKFPDSMNVHFQCVIQVCRNACPNPSCGGPGASGQYQGAPSQQQYNNVDPRYPGAGSAPKPNVAEAPNHFKAPPQALKSPAPSLVSRSPPPPPPPPAGLSPPSKPAAIPQPAAIPVIGQQIHLPAPPSQYNYVNRRGEPDINSAFAIGGQPRNINIHSPEFEPRSLDSDKETNEEVDSSPNDVDSRKKRGVHVAHVYKREATEMTDIPTERIIQVVSPGDVAFNLNPGNETIVVATPLDGEYDPNNICMSTPGFVAGLVMLLLVLFLAIIVAGFLFIRVRSLNKSGSNSSYMQGYDNPEFVKVAQQ